MAAKAYCVEEAIPPYLGGICNKQYAHTVDAFTHTAKSHLRNSLFCPVRHDYREELYDTFLAYTPLPHRQTYRLSHHACYLGNSPKYH